MLTIVAKTLRAAQVLDELRVERDQLCNRDGCFCYRARPEDHDAVVVLLQDARVPPSEVEFVYDAKEVSDG